ncbi:Hypothetical predicted protein [Pelobates cultripes]|uniref:Uncharacterized protein n=1 Tax=Pelobates cultripes TaxID=61616 RepID=A0AAD1R7I4_PELCU|nr:Hypothetical predicted protein [Pelobates cultripes]
MAEDNDRCDEQTIQDGWMAGILHRFDTMCRKFWEGWEKRRQPPAPPRPEIQSPGRGSVRRPLRRRRIKRARAPTRGPRTRAVQPCLDTRAQLHQSLPRKFEAPHWRKDPPRHLLKRHAQPKQRTTRMQRSTRKHPQRAVLPKDWLTTTELLHYHQAPAGYALKQLTGRLAHHLPRGGIS